MSDDASRGGDLDSAPKARVFISYSRKDMAFADRLEAALKARGIEALIDRTEIYAFEDWWKRIEGLIAQADTVVFVISPDAVASDVCHKEVAFAASLNKRFAPVVCRRADDKTVPEALARLNFIFFDDETRLEQSADQLAEALRTDIEWIRKHTEFGEQARRWAAAKGPSGLLLHSPLLEEAERWIASRPPNAPAPTEQTKAFIADSRRAATRRRNILTGSLAVGLLLALGLAGVAFWQRGIAEQQRALAVSNEQRAVAGEEQAKRNEARAKEERDRALLTQSRFLADLGNQRTTAGDASAGVLLSLEALPDANGAERPYAPEAEHAFYAALQKMQEVFVLASDPNVPRSGNTGEVQYLVDAVYSADGRRVATATDGNVGRIWDAATGKLIAVLSGHEDYINSIAFSPDNARVITGAEDARIWDSATGAIILTLPKDNSVTKVAFSPDGHRVLTESHEVGTSFNTVKIYNAETGATIFTLQGNDPVFSPDGRRIATASAGNTARIWDANTGKPVAALSGHKDEVLSVAFSRDSRRLVTGSKDKTARIWDAEAGKPIGVLVGHDSGVTGALFSPDGRRIATVSDDKTARIWDAATSKQIAKLAGHTGPVQHAAFSLDGRLLVTTAEFRSEDRTARIWEVETGTPIAVLLHEDGLGGVAFSPDGLRVVTSSHDGSARIWAITPRYSAQVLAGHTAAMSEVSFSPDGTSVLTVAADKTARVFDVATGKTVATLPADDDEIKSARFSADGMRVLTVSGKKVKGAEITKRGTSAAIWDVRSGKKVANLPGTDGEIKKALFSPDGLKVLTIADNFSAIWDAQTADQLKTLRPEYTILDAAFSPKGDRFATACNDTSVRIYDLETGQSIDPLTGHEAPVLSVAFSPDGTRVASGSSDGTARIWDAETGSAIHVLKGQERWVVNVKFSADGQYVLTQAIDGVRVWDAASGETVTLLAQRINIPDEGLALVFLDPPPKFSSDSRRIVRSSRDGAEVVDVATGKVIAAFDGHDAEFSPDGRSLIATSGNTARIWRLFESNQQEVDEGKGLVSRCLSGSERQAAFLDPQPPAWCIEMEKWPYQTQDWKDWLQFQRANDNPPLPNTAEWQQWREAHK